MSHTFREYPAQPQTQQLSRLPAQPVVAQAVPIAQAQPVVMPVAISAAPVVSAHAVGVLQQPAAMVLDTTGDGQVDTVVPAAHPAAMGLDTTGDGRADAVGLDTTGDGRVDTVVPMRQ